MGLWRRDGLIVASAPIEEAVGADLLYLAHLRLLLAAVGDLARELLKRRHLGQRVRIRVAWAMWTKLTPSSSRKVA
jgi:hypothetical protein